MKRLLKILGIGLLIIILLGVFAGWQSHEPLPKVKEHGPKADALARKVEVAVNKAAWDTTRYVNWTFPSGTSYQWDKANHRVIVSWDDYKVLLHTPTQTGEVRQAGQLLSAGPEKDKVLQKAWSQFANDSFWVCAPMKLFDPGTKRGIVELEDGNDGLLISYTSGGVTPGDHYLWLLDETGLPTAWKMWVSIIPIGGVEFQWTEWTSPDGPRIARDHPSKMFNVAITNLAFPTYTMNNDPFSNW